MGARKPTHSRKPCGKRTWRDVVLHALHLCSGYGGFELALGDAARTVAHVERDAYAAAVLVARMGEARLDQAPVWSDLCTFDTGPWVGRVDIITAGFPCQPFSAAGKRAGTDDDRWLWPDICRIIGEVRPRCVFLENVPGVVRHGLPHVLADLAGLGFDAEWGLCGASDVGAPHRRQRFWLVADSDRDGQSLVGRKPEHDRDARHDTDGSGGADVADSKKLGRGEWIDGAQSCRLSADTQAGDSDVADPACVDEREPHHTGCTIARHHARPDIGGHRFPPRPDDHDGWQQWDGPQPCIRRSADGPTRWLADGGTRYLADQLHLGGNGLVPQCAAEAWRQLTERLAR